MSDTLHTPQSLVLRLEQLWKKGEQPDAFALLAAAGPCGPECVAAVLVVDQWQRWRAGQRVPAEDYLRRSPTLADHPNAALEVIYGEFLVRQELGEQPTQQEYLDRFPQFAAGLREQFAMFQALNTLNDNTGQEAHTLPCSAPPERPTVPGYEVLEKLGRGGMGVVYRARHLTLHRQVAVKMIRAGTEAGPAELARFRTEAEAVARLQHPHIVQIHEIGEAGGRPFIALEFVDGLGLSEYLAGTPQPPRTAAGLVEKLARAMGAAHQRGIVHRDLKPSNILLASEGRHLASGGREPPGDATAPGGVSPPLADLVPKITDFGLAKLLHGAAGATAADGQTESGAVLGTPSYMAPEQARGRSKEVGPAADVYALGAILYELLTGRPPFKAESPWETLQQVINEEPVPPTRLQPGLPRDVETICLKCLQKEARRRYESADALADDLGRFAAGRPIRARPVGAAGRLWRWARREPVVAGLLGALLLALTGGLAGVGLLWRRAEANYAESRRQYDRAEESSRDARRAVEAMLGEVAEVRLKDIPEMGPVQRALLEKAAAFYEKFLGERGADPALREEAARAYNRLGLINQQLGRLSESEAAYQKALALHTALAEKAPGEPRYRRLMAGDLFKRLAQLYLSGNRFAQARAPLLKARAILEPLAAEHTDQIEYQVDLADCYNNLGSLWMSTGHLDRAEEAFGNSLKIRHRLARARPAVVQFRNRLAASHNNLALVYKDSKRSVRAEAEYKEALALWDGLLHDNPGVIEYRRAVGLCHNNLGWLYLIHLGQPSRAEASFRQALRVREKLAREHPSFVGCQTDLADTYRSLGLVCERLGRRDESEGFALKALAIMELFPSDVPRYRFDLANSYQVLAWRYYTTGKMERAERFYDKALALCNGLVAQHPEVGQYLRTLGFVHHGKGILYVSLRRPKDAEGAYREAIRVREKLARASRGQPESLDNLAWSCNNLGNLYAETGRKELAEAARKKAFAIRERLVRENPRVPDYAASLAVSYGAQADRLRDGGEALEALDWYGRAIRLLEGVLRKQPRRAQERKSLCLTYWGRAAALSKKLGRHKEALPDWERARAYDNGEYWDQIWVHQAITYARLGDHLRATGDMKALEARAAAEHKTVKGGTYYVMAFVYALSATAAADDPRLSAADRARLDPEYSARAVQLFRRLHGQGHFKDLKEVEHLRQATELEGLRQRDDFQKLLGEMQQSLKARRG
jgi:tetratricopeptide (TPR) repeat protein